MANDATGWGSHIGAVCHASARVWCGERQRPAVVSVIDRDDTGGAIRFVLWCSLRACDGCSEQCLCAPLADFPTSLSPAGAADVPPPLPQPPSRG